MEPEQLAQHAQRLGRHILTTPRPNAPRAGLIIERIGTGQDADGRPTIDVEVRDAGGPAGYLGDIARVLDELPREAWSHVRVLDAQGRAILHQEVVE